MIVTGLNERIVSLCTTGDQSLHDLLSSLVRFPSLGEYYFKLCTLLCIWSRVGEESRIQKYGIDDRSEAGTGEIEKRILACGK